MSETTERCGAVQELSIESQIGQEMRCFAPAGHHGPHRDVALDSDDNAITVRWSA